MDSITKSISDAYLKMLEIEEGIKVEVDDEDETDVDTKKSTKDSGNKEDPAAKKPVDDKEKKKDDDEVKEEVCSECGKEPCVCEVEEACGDKKYKKESVLQTFKDSLTEGSTRDYVDNRIAAVLKKAGVTAKVKKEIGYTKYTLPNGKTITNDGNVVDVKKGGKTVKSFFKPKLQVARELPDMVESVQLEEGKSKAAAAIIDYAKKSGGIDKKDFMAIAGKLDNFAATGNPGNRADLAKMLKKMDTDPRDKAIEIMMATDPSMAKSIMKKAGFSIKEEAELQEALMKFDAQDAIGDFKKGKVSKIKSNQSVNATVMPVRGNSFDTDDGYVPVLKNFSRKGKMTKVDLKAGQEVAIDVQRGNVYGMVGDKFFYTSTGNVDLKEGVEIEEAAPKISKGKAKGSISATGLRGKGLKKFDVDVSVKNGKFEFRISDESGKFQTVGIKQAAKMLGESFDDLISEASGDKEAYQKFFQAALKKYGVKSPSELDGEKEKSFYDYIDKNWEGDNEKKEVGESTISEAKFTDKQIKQAYGIINDKRWKSGNMTHIVNTIEKIAKGLSKHPGVQKALKATNESKAYKSNALNSIVNKLKGDE